MTLMDKLINNILVESLFMIFLIVALIILILGSIFVLNTMLQECFEINIKEIIKRRKK